MLGIKKKASIILVMQCTACNQIAMISPYTEHAVTLYLQVTCGEKIFPPAA